MRGWELVVLALIAVGLRLVHLDHSPQFDEMFHILAARSWAADGTLALADGSYERAAGFTATIGLLFRFFGESLPVARIPSVVSGVLLVVVAGWWAGVVAGRRAGWVAALLVATDPTAIYLSQLARFYAPHALFVLLAAVASFFLVHEWSRRPGWWRGLVAVAIALLLAGAYHLQITTLIAVLGLALWASGALARWWWLAGRSEPRWRWIPYATAGLVAALALGGIVSGSFTELWDRFRTTALWSLASADEPRYYKWLLEGSYPVFFTLLPLSVLVSWRAAPRLAAQCTVLFATAFVLHSIGASKGERYFFHAMPFFHLLTGVALASLWPFLRDLVRDLVNRHSARSGLHRVATATALGVLIAFVTATTPALSRTRRMLTADAFDRPSANPHWDHAAPVLIPWAESSSVVIASAVPKTVYYLGRGDVTMSRSQLAELGGRDRRETEFATDHRTGRPMISTVGSLERLLTCHRTGLVVVEQAEWRQPFGTVPEVADYLEQQMIRIPLPEAWRIHGFRWQHGDDWTTQPCPLAVPRRRAGPGGGA